MNGIEAEAREYTDRAFARHVVQEVGRSGVIRCWRCGEPDTGVHAFWITTYPGGLVITGDIGDLIVERSYDMLPWCRGSCDSTDYFSGKVPHAIPTTEFSPDKCREWIQENLDELQGEEREDDRYIEVLNDAMDDLESGEHGDQHMYTATSEVWQGNDPPDFMDWNRNFLMCRDAIRWFVNHHTEEVVQKTELKQERLYQ